MRTRNDRWRRLAAALAFVAAPTLALSPVNKSFFGGVAIGGYDAVAYFTDGRPAAGKAAHAFEWNGAVWRFASAEHRDLFAAAPEKYAPQYGGYCAWAVSKGYTADIDPEAWSIVDGKLYLNNSVAVKAEWEKDVPGNIARADVNWPRLVGEKGSALRYRDDAPALHRGLELDGASALGAGQ